MSKYTFTFKKDDIFVEFITEDKEVIERQFQKWVTDADDYVSNKVQKPIKKTNVNSVKEEVKVDFSSTVGLESEQDTQLSSEAETNSKKENEGNKKETIGSITKPKIFNQASNLLKTINIIQNPIDEEHATSQIAFDTVLEESIEKGFENSSFDRNKIKDPVFLNFVHSKNTTDKFHYLMITAYYLLEFEKMERFSLKQINAKLMQNLSEVIDHTTLQEAINQDFIELVPDLTGTSEIGEYRITPAGEDFFANRI